MEPEAIAARVCRAERSSSSRSAAGSRTGTSRPPSGRDLRPEDRRQGHGPARHRPGCGARSEPRCSRPRDRPRGCRLPRAVEAISSRASSKGARCRWRRRAGRGSCAWNWHRRFGAPRRPRLAGPVRLLPSRRGLPRDGRDQRRCRRGEYERAKRPQTRSSVRGRQSERPLPQRPLNANFIADGGSPSGSSTGSTPAWATLSSI